MTDSARINMNAFMERSVLTELQVDGGKQLLARLVEEGVPVTGAVWLKEAESGRWYLYIVTPLVPEGGATRAAYGRVNAVIDNMPQPFWVNWMEVKVVEPGSSVGKVLQELYKRNPGPAPIRYSGASFGDLPIEGAFVYPPSAVANGKP
jgi:hypothetical protein